ncbi:MAG: hotdog fold thioesterase [Actinomycetaceae bacterium]|nr:hotdog fold thioesterase [Actinomycetaceae bacterium]
MRFMERFADDTLMALLDMTVQLCTREETRVRMPIAGRTQIQGILHGGASAALAETAASLAAYQHAMELSTSDGVTRIPVGTELTINHVRPGTGEWVEAVAKSVHCGRTRTVHQVRISNEDGRLISTALVANQLVTR